VGEDGGPDLCDPPASQHLPLRRRQDWDRIAKDLRPICTAGSEPMAAERFTEFAEK
jgi:hypothetical protein